MLKMAAGVVYFSCLLQFSNLLRDKNKFPTPSETKIRNGGQHIYGNIFLLKCGTTWRQPLPGMTRRQVLTEIFSIKAKVHLKDIFPLSLGKWRARCSRKMFSIRATSLLESYYSPSPRAKQKTLSFRILFLHQQ